MAIDYVVGSRIVDNRITEPQEHYRSKSGWDLFHGTDECSKDVPMKKVRKMQVCTNRQVLKMTRSMTA